MNRCLVRRREQAFSGFGTALLKVGRKLWFLAGCW